MKAPTLISLLLFGTLSACAPNPGPPPAPASDTTGDLLTSCDVHGDCASGYCDPSDKACRLPVGADCAREDDCAVGSVCAPAASFGGRACQDPQFTTWCSEDSHCGADGHCAGIADAGGRGTCDRGPGAEKPCVAHADCGPAESCRPIDSAGGLRRCGAVPRAGEPCLPSADPSPRTCESGSVCLHGLCAALSGWACVSDSVCADGLQCTDSVCGPAPVPLFAPCENGDACSDGGFCFEGICRVAGKGLNAACTASQDDCPAPLTCAPTGSGSNAGLCKLADGASCSADAHCAAGLCIRGQCSAPHGPGETCGTVVGGSVAQSGAAATVLYEDKHCSGSLICHSVRGVCVAPHAGEVFAKATRQIECSLDLQFFEPAGECMLPGPAMWSVAYAPLVAVAKGDSWGKPACVSLQELAAQHDPPPAGYRRAVIPTAWSRLTWGEDVGAGDVYYDETADAVCARVRGRANGFWGIGKGKNNELHVTLVMVTYNPSKMAVLPADQGYPYQPQRPLAEQLCTLGPDPVSAGSGCNLPVGQSPHQMIVDLPDGWDGIGLSAVWSHSPADDDGHFLNLAASFKELQPVIAQNTELLGYNVARGFVLQHAILGECGGSPRLVVQPLVIAWRHGMSPSLVRRKIAARSGGETWPALVPGAPTLGLVNLAGVPCRYDLLDKENPFGSCAALWTNTPLFDAQLSWQASCQFKNEDEGPYKLPGQDQVLDTAEGIGDGYCKAAGGLADLCTLGIDLGRWGVEKFIDALLAGIKGCLGDPCDDDVFCKLSLMVAAGYTTFGFSLHDDGSGNAAVMVEALALQFHDDANYFDVTPVTDLGVEPGSESALCDTQADCAAALACVDDPDGIDAQVCLPKANAACLSRCADPARVCRPADHDAESPTCLLPGPAGAACYLDTECAAGLTCFPGDYTCWSPIGVPLEGPAACPPSAVLVDGRCAFVAGGPCHDDTWCLGSCDLTQDFEGAQGPEPGYGLCVNSSP
jgi:hypothetical protein